jgi:pyruvyl transferase EpsO
MSTRESLRVAVRDQSSYDLLRNDLENLILSPDAVHVLGRIESKPPITRFVIPSRRDKEASKQPSPVGVTTVDWTDDDWLTTTSRRASWKFRQVSLAKPLFYRPPRVWRLKAQKRFERGVRVLPQGEVIITDRLHAMLIGLQMGRAVIAIDNNNHKLTSYAETWFENEEPPVRFAKTFADALRIANHV